MSRNIMCVICNPALNRKGITPWHCTRHLKEKWKFLNEETRERYEPTIIQRIKRFFLKKFKI